MIFWDTSAMICRFDATDRRHPQAVNLWEKEDRHAVSVLLGVEAAGALVRRFAKGATASGGLLDRLDMDMRGCVQVDATTEVRKRALQVVWDRGLRGLDALHIASALWVGHEVGPRRLWFVTGDAEQAEAARREGLRVVLLG